MSANYTAEWTDEATQCSHCQFFQTQEEKSVCVPNNMSFADALAYYGEILPTGHCEYFRTA